MSKPQEAERRAMEKCRYPVVVAGDAAIDWFLFPVPLRENCKQNWERHPTRHAAVLPGGAFLLTQFLRQALAAAGRSEEVFAPPPPDELRITPPEQVIHSNAMLDIFSVGAAAKEQDPGKRKNEALRIRDWLGFIGPAGGAAPQQLAPDQPLQADMVVLDDAGNGFRDSPESWPTALASQPAPIVVHKMCRPLIKGPLWERLSAGQFSRHVVVLNAEDLRRTSDVDISRALSWERTAKDTVFVLERSTALAPLRRCPFVVILFGADGAIVRHGGECARSTLIFDPQSFEGTFASRLSGSMSGLTSAFTACLAAALVERGMSGLESGVRRGLNAMRTLLQTGFVKSDDGIAYPFDRFFSEPVREDVFECCEIEKPQDLNAVDPGYWRILDQKTRHTVPLVAEQLVREGKAAGLRGVPVGAFANLRTIDRAEIESFAAIRELILEFLSNPKAERPLSFAVFGPPGAGKSFGVKQVLKGIHGYELGTVTFNISQFRSYDDLVAAFHEVRNISLRGKLPFVFFDEFDSASAEGPLGWLKYFLAPMQDAEFKEAGAVHPIGKSIFVFAGGTRSSYEAFVPHGAPPDADDKAKSAADAARAAFVAAKGPDFVSRLRGYINIMGPNRQHAGDHAYLIRRAMVLRAMLQGNAKAKGLLDEKKRLNIDPGVLRALLYVGSYRHGTRSMEAIFDMSHLAGKERFELSALPPKDQLDLHVDGDEFLMLAQGERYLSLLATSPRLPTDSAAADTAPSLSFRERELKFVDQAAEKIHEMYRQRRLLDNPNDTMTAPFEELPREKQMSNRDAAADIPKKLRAIDHGLRRLAPGATPRTPDITDEEVLTLAHLEHERWMAEQQFQGYVLGPTRDAIRKTSPYLIPFDQLREQYPDIARYNLDSVFAIPVVLRDMSLEIYRLEEADELSDSRLIESLARVIHESYIAERKKEGDTVQTNQSLVEFDKLLDDLKASNLDNAASIPRKLKKLGYHLQRVLPGTEPATLVLSDDECERMAIMEHTRWNWQRILQGWTYKPGAKNLEKKTTPHLVSWAELPDNIRGYDRQTVRLIPQHLKRAGLEAIKDHRGC